MDFRKGRIDEATCHLRVAAREAFRAPEKGNPDPDGYQRFGCPASSGSPTVRCPLKPATNVFSVKALRTVRPAPELVANPPRACRQQSVTVPPEAGAKLAQTLVYGSEEHSRVYGTLRNSIEGMNGFAKDPAFEAMGESGRRRISGVAAGSILVAFQLMAANLRKIDGFLQSVRRAAAGLFQPPRRRRRQNRPLSAWDPRVDGSEGSGRSPPAESDFAET